MGNFISRDAVLELIDNAPIIAGNENESLISAPELSDKIYCLSAADVQLVVHGKWIRRSDDSCVATCSVCGNENNYAFCIMSVDEPSLVQQDMFCPFCGADMREV